MNYKTDRASRVDRKNKQTNKPKKIIQLLLMCFTHTVLAI